MSAVEYVGLALGGLLVLLFVVLVVVFQGVGLAVTGLIVGALLYLFGLATLGTVKAIVLWFFAVGCALGILKVLVFGAAAG